MICAMGQNSHYLAQKTPTPIIIIGGPTASGKSALAVALAEKINGTLICGDALQLYAALPLLTAQPTLAEIKRVPHRLYNSRDIHENAHVAWWLKAACAAIQAVTEQGRMPIIVGGTGLYLNALTKGLATIPEIPAARRLKTQKLCEKKGVSWMHHVLNGIDPVMGKRLPPQDTQRILRAYSVHRQTGISLSQWQLKNDRGLVAHLRPHWIVLQPLKSALQSGIERRLSAMIDQGVLAEVASLAAHHCAPGATLSKAIGIREFSAHLAGMLTLEEAHQKITQQTLAYVKRQLTWFRHQTPADALRFDTAVTGQTLDEMVRACIAFTAPGLSP